jgi:hypothetical protein
MHSTMFTAIDPKDCTVVCPDFQPCRSTFVLIRSLFRSFDRLNFNIGQSTIDLLGSSGEVGQSAVRMWLAWLVAWWLADLWQSYVFDSGVYGLLTLVTYYSPSAES